jgi:hypothetical protein
VSNAAASSRKAVIAGATIPNLSGGYVLLTVSVNNVDRNIAELALVLTGVVPAEDEVTTARENDTNLGQCATTVTVEGHDQVVGGRGRRQRLGHLSSLALYRTDPRLRIGLLHSARMDPQIPDPSHRAEDSPGEVRPGLLRR